MGEDMLTLVAWRLLIPDLVRGQLCGLCQCLSMMETMLWFLEPGPERWALLGREIFGFLDSIQRQKVCAVKVGLLCMLEKGWWDWFSGFVQNTNKSIQLHSPTG